MERGTYPSSNKDPQLLVVDADVEFQDKIRSALAASGYAVRQALSGQQALCEVQGHDFNTILLDWELPDMGGLDLLSKVRQVSAVPVVFLTAHAALEDIAICFERSADDYIVKPFDPAMLIQRLARYASPQFAAGKTVGRFRLWPDRHLLDKDGQTIVLTELESKLLDCLFASPEQPVTARNLFRAVWSPSDVSVRQMLHIVETAIVQLQNKIEAYPQEPRFIALVPGGYLFTPNPRDLDSQPAGLPSKPGQDLPPQDWGEATRLS